MHTTEGEGYVSADYVEVYTEHSVAESKEEEEARLQKEEEERRRAEEARRAAEAARAAEVARTAEAARATESARAAEAARAAERARTSETANRAAQSTGTKAAGNTTAEKNVTPPKQNASLGQSIADYAVQFIGNPYVWGGTSLTNGADCSGFVMSVYKNFGINLPRTSGEQGKSGKNVGGLSNAQAGDLVSYSGHIGIYIGNGKIVHASTAKTGIKISNANYRQVLSVRRIV